MKLLLTGTALTFAMIAGSLLLVLSYEPVKTVPMTGGWVATVTPDEVQKANAQGAMDQIRRNSQMASERRRAETAPK
ncbi:hypothetical protein [Xanthobacter wiegelii]|uniref:hypothetical protein n=1 Tax=Xanthobacter wiegelii TaxID=3119913 RepID=UPI0037263575